jgi:hypothetical protein
VNRNDIIRMAREAGDVETDSRGRETFSFDCYGLERFAALVAAAEREACLAILRDMEGKKWHLAMHCEEIKGVSLHDAYAAIRARGNPE